MKTATDANYQSDKFYRRPCWIDVWTDTYDVFQLEFWSRLDDRSALMLLSRLEQAGFLVRLNRGRHPARFRVCPSYYLGLQFYRRPPKAPVPSTKSIRLFRNTAQFQGACQRIWTSMRIFQTFSIGQLQACSDVSNDVAQAVVAQFYQLDYVQLDYRCHELFAGNEDQYHLIRNTGASVPFLCANGILYDANTHTIYLTRI